ncbi:GGDEF domain-containing protein [Chloracidobacterium validum]|uniref:diguanylate cyclase n=1 Tax=Chloracidobacterium validum TaxID=2821543 RepID=A0ABX8B5K0_9BACT|nr:GGDEF domain-containing protein [Chloracidobacterium validum]QUW02247.1 GGDEF domain-containing protein [Chloracidobacterium validum]
MRGDYLGSSFRIERSVMRIGRGSDAELRLENDDEASRLHAKIECSETPTGHFQYWLTDLRSTNGTQLNGIPLTPGEPVLLHDGDKFSIGRHILKFTFLDDIDEEFHRRITDLITHDDLTGLLTRKSFILEMEREMARSNRYGHPFGLLMMDIDFFKRVNDTYGHLIGSQVLREVAVVIRQTLRDSDIAGRYGGEEYIALLPETDRVRAHEAAERIRAAIESAPFTASLHDPNLKLNLTISVGISSYPGDATQVNDLIERADEAMYEAKRRGRNLVQIAGQSSATRTTPPSLPTAGRPMPRLEANPTEHLTIEQPKPAGDS